MTPTTAGSVASGAMRAGSTAARSLTAVFGIGPAVLRMGPRPAIEYSRGPGLHGGDGRRIAGVAQRPLQPGARLSAEELLGVAEVSLGAAARGVERARRPRRLRLMTALFVVEPAAVGHDLRVLPRRAEAA